MRTSFLHSSFRRRSSALIAVGIAAASVGVLAAPAGARVETKNDKFCEILATDQGVGIDFEGLGPAEGEYAAALVRKLAKTGVPPKLKKDFKKLAKIYDRIGNGEPSDAVIREQLPFVQKALTRFSKYFQKNCVPAVPAT
jgi:hypothetical protein